MTEAAQAYEFPAIRTYFQTLGLRLPTNLSLSKGVGRQ